MGGGTAKVKERGSGSAGAKRTLQNHDSIGRGRGARKLRVTQQIPTLLVDDSGTDPEIEIVCRWPGIGTTGGDGLDVVGLSMEGLCLRLRAGNSVGRLPVRIGAGQIKLNTSIGGQARPDRRHARRVGVGFAEV